MRITRAAMLRGRGTRFDGTYSTHANTVITSRALVALDVDGQKYQFHGKNTRTVITAAIMIILRGCYRHSSPSAGFSTRQVPRWSLILYWISSCISSTLATNELNSVQFREAKASSPFPYTHMPSKAYETLIYPAVSHILRLVRLPGECHNTTALIIHRFKSHSIANRITRIDYTPYIIAQTVHRIISQRLHIASKSHRSTGAPQHA